MLRILISSFILCLGLQMNAQKIAVVDVSSILAEMPEFQKAEDDLNKLAADWRQDIAEHLEDVKSMYNKYQAEQVLLSDKMRQSREEEILNREKDIREIQRQKFGPEGELFKRREQLIGPLQNKVFDAIQEYSSESGFDIIMDKNSSAGILFANEQYDKTDNIRRKLGIR